MLTETKISNAEKSQSQKSKFESYQNSLTSMQIAKPNDWNQRQIISSREERLSKQSGSISISNKRITGVCDRQDSKRQLPIMSNQKIPEIRFYHGTDNKRQPQLNSNHPNQLYSIHNTKHRDTRAIHTADWKDSMRSNIKLEDYRNVYLPSSYPPYNSLNFHTNPIKQPADEFMVKGKGNSELNSPKIQRRHNVSSRKSISNANLSQAISGTNVSYLQEPSRLSSPNHKYQAKHPLSPTSLRPSNLMSENSSLSKEFNFVEYPSNMHNEQHQRNYLSQRQFQLQQKQHILQQQLIQLQQQQYQILQAQQQQQSHLHQIRTMSTVTQVPYYEKRIEYVPEVIMVPQQKIIQKKYFIQNIVDYVLRVEQYVQGYDLIPKEVINYRLQYQLVEDRIVHLPNDQQWLDGQGKIQRRRKDRNKSKSISKTKTNNEFVPNPRDTKRVTSPDGFIGRNYHHSTTSFGQRGHSLTSKQLDRVSSFGERLPQQTAGNTYMMNNVYNTRLPINPFQVMEQYYPQCIVSPQQHIISPQQQSPNQSSPYFPSPTPSNISHLAPLTYIYPNKQDFYDSMVSYYTNRPSSRNMSNSRQSRDLSLNPKRRHKQTFHVTSETTSTHNDNPVET